MENVTVTPPARVRELLERLGYRGHRAHIKYIGGISNDNFLIDDRYVLKVPYDPLTVRRDSFPLEMEKACADLKLAPPPIAYRSEDGLKLTLYLKDYRSTKLDNLDENSLKNVIEALKVIHRLPLTPTSRLDYYGDIRRWRTGLKTEPTKLNKAADSFLASFRPLYETLERNSEPSHLDLVSSNILFRKTDVRFIDFEYATYAFRWFDLVSLLSENDLKAETQEKIIDLYCDGRAATDEFKTLWPTLTRALDLYWYFWARARMRGYPKDGLFQAIAAAKASSFLL